MNNPSNARDAGYIRIRVFWLTSIALSLLLTLVVNGIILLFHH